MLGTNPANLKSGGVSPNRTINVPASNKRHIDVSEFGDKRDVSKSPGLGPENSIVNQDLTFSLGIETQVEGNNVLDNSQTVHSQVQSRSSSPLDITGNNWNYRDDLERVGVAGSRAGGILSLHQDSRHHG